MPAKILIVDESSMRQPFLLAVLQEAGEVVHYPDAEAATRALAHGLKVRVAVLDYRAKMAPLVGIIRSHCPQVKIIAYGRDRADLPLGVDYYMKKPVLALALRDLVLGFE